MSLPNETIEAIRERAHIVDVIGRHVSLKKQGREYSGLCPFHNEKTPSFSVSPDKGVFFCFGCQAAGDVFTFVMRFLGVPFQDAVRELAGHAGVALAEESPIVRRQKQHEARLAALNAAALEYFERALWHPKAAVARRYLKERGVPEGFARRRRLGYGGPSGELLAHLTKERGFQGAELHEAGLLNEAQDRSLFDERLIFPIADAQGRVAGFGGRSLSADSAAKYINSRDSVLFHKKSLLYGLKVAEPAMRKTKQAVLVEGYMDVLACQMAGIDQAVAALGTAFSPQHAEQIGRLARECVVMFDGDAAGIRASRKAAQSLLSGKLKALVAPLPKGKDPDNILQEQGSAGLKTVLATARPAVEHFMETAFADAAMSVEAKAEAARELVPLIAAFGSGLERDLYMSQLAFRVGVSVEQLQRDVAVARKNLEKSAQKGQKGTSPKPVKAEGDVAQPPLRQPEAFELEMLRQLLLHPELQARFSELAEFAVSEEMRSLLDDLACSDKPLQQVLEAHQVAPSWIQRLVSVRPAAPVLDDGAEDIAARTFEDAMAQLKWRHVDVALQDVIRDLLEVEAAGGDTCDLLRRKRELTRRKIALDRRRKHGWGLQGKSGAAS